MASLHKDPRGRSPFWYCSYKTPDGVWHLRSTKSADRKQAEEICRTMAQAAALGRTRKLTPEAARDVIARAVADVFLASNDEVLPSTTIRSWCDQWLESKKIEATPSTVARYTGILQRFYAFLDRKVDRDIATLTAANIGAFRDRLAKELSRASANVAIKCLRACLSAATKQGLLTNNPAALVDKLKMRGASARRPFTVTELQRVLKIAGDSEWRGMILAGIYTGARLGDIARLTWRNVNLESTEVTFTAGKTGKRMVLPMARPLADFFEDSTSADDPDAFVFPNAAEAAKRTGTLSNQFYSLLVEAGLAEARSKKNTGKGRNAARPVGELSFHSLRHTAVTFLKAAGVSDALAQAIAGHESAAVSRIYTHLDTETLRGAIDKLPDVTKSSLPGKSAASRREP